MSPRPKHTKPDAVQADLIRDLERVGMVVWNLSDCGGEVLDLMCFWRGRAVPVEVKSPGGRPTPAQGVSFERLRAAGVEPIMAGTAEEVLAAWPE